MLRPLVDEVPSKVRKTDERRTAAGSAISLDEHVVPLQERCTVQRKTLLYCSPSFAAIAQSGIDRRERREIDIVGVRPKW
jgi:hypothetical protein